jgi:predicted nucleotidyltransferase
MEDREMEQTEIKENVIKEIRSLAQKYDITEVILFGSRARGDYGRASDLDLAVRGGNIARFALDVDEMTSTPLKYDIINLDGTVSDELRQSIQTEGKILYEKI